MNLSKKTKQLYEPANMSKNECVKSKFNESPNKSCPLVAKVHYTFY